jgi:formate dehydrogenase subunit delta
MPHGRPRAAGLLSPPSLPSNAMDLANLHYMANQIARNLAAGGEDAAIAATAQHLTDFWDPRMKSAILASDQAALSPIARAAVARLAPIQTHNERPQS